MKAKSIEKSTRIIARQEHARLCLKRKQIVENEHLSNEELNKQLNEIDYLIGYTGDRAYNTRSTH